MCSARESVALYPEGSAAEKHLACYLVRWNDDNTLTAIHHALYLQCRE